MDCDVELQKYADHAFVIERPAGRDLIADAATAILSKHGMRVEFGAAGQAAKAHSKRATAAMPEGVAFLERRSGPSDRSSSVIVAGPARASSYGTGTKAVESMTLDTYRMLGHSLCGSDRETAAIFSKMMAVRHGISFDAMVDQTRRMADWQKSGPRRGDVAATMAKLDHSRDVMRSDKIVTTGDARMIARIAENFRNIRGLDAKSHNRSEERRAAIGRLRTAAAAQGRTIDEWAQSAGVRSANDFSSFLHDVSLRASEGDQVARAAISLGLETSPFGAGSTRPQLGEHVPSLSELDATAGKDEPRFEARPYGSAKQGPAWLPERFNETSKRTVQGIHPDLLQVVARAREISGVDFEVVPRTGGIRDDALQAKLKSSGKSKAKTPRHVIGYAIDLVPVRNGRMSFNDMRGFDQIRDAMAQAAEELSIPVQWGGNWTKLVDKPHFELDRKVYPAPGEEPDAGSVMVAFR
jgi:peptidoglycan L-alanyl-D-glutamate endopeptidase CwlK